MPELPEVETTRKGIAPYVVGEVVKDVIIRERQLRWPIPTTLKRSLKNQLIRKLRRRAKYLLFYTDKGCMILHLGMSGNLRILDNKQAHEKHDHVDIIFESGNLLRFHDPRKFGSILWTKDDPLEHKLISHLGPEPLSDEFNIEYLFSLSRKRTKAIKTFIMDSHIVVGVGNIYASEALFRAGIKPTLQTGKVSKTRYEKLVIEIKNVLAEAIEKGGTTLRDFFNSDGKPGYFTQELQVYNREGEACNKCMRKIKMIRLGQRSTFYCSHCQS
ncbi:MAG TPA: bifunctional DNA-formamidopyrimidine glycosylase/DNA-(apurinic or apyrimidinic site) lyase [Thiotrichaceae bacterium]|jgi:formamidopyrimidine-DNA glycosylase|nr:bifunctional DNA-formamidopyrimidine glycosylase/DNA-(apurinic or apyrimidinic site) lyase [Thiotrichaceae bacterium]